MRGAHESTQDLAALGRLTLLQAPLRVAAAVPPALGGLIELRVHELGWHTGVGMQARSCLCVSALPVMSLVTLPDEAHRSPRRGFAET